MEDQASLLLGNTINHYDNKFTLLSLFVINRSEGNLDVCCIPEMVGVVSPLSLHKSIYTGVVSMSKPILTNQCYVYVYLDPRKPGTFVYGTYYFYHEPFYVGKGINGRALTHLKIAHHNQHLNNKIKKIQRIMGYDPYIIIYNKEMNDIDAYSLEEQMISVIGRVNIKTGPLCNLTPGGMGTGSGENSIHYGKKLSDEARKKLSLAHTGIQSGKIHPLYGKPRSDETKKKISLANKGKFSGEDSPMYGKSLPDEIKQKISKTLTGRKQSEETIQKRSESLSGVKHPMYGKHHTDESKQKNRDAHVGKKHTQESKEKMSRASKARRHSDESRKKISESAKNRPPISEETRQKMRDAHKKP